VGTRDFVSSISVQTSTGAYEEWAPGLFPVGKVSRRGFGHPTPSKAEGENTWNCTSASIDMIGDDISL